MRTRKPWIFVVALALSACASGSPEASEGPETPRGSQDRLERAQLAEWDNLSAYDAVRRLRPLWLTGRGLSDPVMVHLDGAPRGGVEVLHSIQAVQVFGMQYMSAPDATNRFGTGYRNGVILVATRR